MQELRTRLKVRSSRILQSEIFGIFRVFTLMETLNDWHSLVKLTLDSGYFHDRSTYQSEISILGGIHFTILENWSFLQRILWSFSTAEEKKKNFFWAELYFLEFRMDDNSISPYVWSPWTIENDQQNPQDVMTPLTGATDVITSPLWKTSVHGLTVSHNDSQFREICK